MTEITRKQILKATGDELSRLAGEVLSYEHVMYDVPPESKQCKFCDGTILLSTFPCKKNNTPIPLTWPEAMKWRDWAKITFGHKSFESILPEVFYHGCPAAYEVALNSNCGANYYGLYFFAIDAQPEHYIKAACLAKIGETK